MFFRNLKDIQAQRKQILELAKTWLFAKSAFQRNVFRSVLISVPV